MVAEYRHHEQKERGGGGFEHRAFRPAIPKIGVVMTIRPRSTAPKVSAPNCPSTVQPPPWPLVHAVGDAGGAKESRDMEVWAVKTVSALPSGFRGS